MSNFSLSSFQNSKVANFSRNRLIALKQLLVLRFKNWAYAHDPLTHGNWSRGPGQHGGKRLESGELPGVPRLSMRKVVSATTGGNAGGATGKKVSKAVMARVSGAGKKKGKAVPSVEPVKLTLRQRIEKLYNDYQKIKDTLTSAQKVEQLKTISSKIKVLEEKIASSKLPKVKKVQEVQETPIARPKGLPDDATTEAKPGRAKTRNKKGDSSDESTVPSKAQRRREALQEIKDSSGRSVKPKRRLVGGDAQDKSEPAGFFKPTGGKNQDQEYIEKAMAKFKKLTPQKQKEAIEKERLAMQKSINNVSSTANVTRMILGDPSAKTWQVTEIQKAMFASLKGGKGNKEIENFKKEIMLKVATETKNINMKLFGTNTPKAQDIAKVQAKFRNELYKKQDSERKERENQNVKTRLGIAKIKTGVEKKITDDQEAQAVVREKFRAGSGSPRDIQLLKSQLQRVEQAYAVIGKSNKPTEAQKQMLMALDTKRSKIEAALRNQGKGPVKPEINNLSMKLLREIEQQTTAAESIKNPQLRQSVLDRIDKLPASENLKLLWKVQSGTATSAEREKVKDLLDDADES